MRGSQISIVSLGCLLLVCPPPAASGQAPASVTANPSVLTGGTGSVARISLSAPAPAGGLVLRLQSSHPAIAGVPASITVAGDASTASFPIRTVPVGQDMTVTVTATGGGASQSVDLSVRAARPTSVSLTPGGLVGGRTANGVVQLSGPAADGFSLQFSSSHPALATVPPSIVVRPGGTTADFAVATVPVVQTTLVTITAAANGESRTAQLNIATPAAGVLFTPGSVAGGASASGTVTLNGAAPEGGLNVQLTSGNTTVVLVPPSVTIPQGETTATFAAGTFPVAQTTIVSITAAVGAARATGALLVRSPSVATIVLAPTSVLGGGRSTATVTLASPAPAGGLPIALTSSKPGVASVPQILTVDANQTTGSFSITAHPVATLTAALINAITGGNTTTTTLIVRPPEPVLINLIETSVIGGDSATGRVILNAPPPAGLEIHLTSSAPQVASVPSTVTTSAGVLFKNFTISTVPVAAAVTVTIGSTSSETRPGTLTIQPPSVHSLTFAPATVVPLQATTGTVTLNGAAPSAGVTVQLSSSQPSLLAMPQLVTVPAGEKTATFPVAPNLVSEQTNVTVTARTNTVSRSATITIRPSVW